MKDFSSCVEEEEGVIEEEVIDEAFYGDALHWKWLASIINLQERGVVILCTLQNLLEPT